MNPQESVTSQLLLCPLVQRYTTFWILQLFDPEMAVLSHCTYGRPVSSSVDGVTFTSPVSLDSLPAAHHCSLEA